MTRLLLALPVILGLWLPSTAVTLGPGASEGDVAAISAPSGDYEALAIRGLTGVEIVAGWGSRGHAGQKTPPSHGALIPLPDAGGPISRPTTSPRTVRTDVLLPHGEHSPYFPTAPPSDR